MDQWNSPRVRSNSWQSDRRDSLVSPLTQAPCSFYRTTIAREKPGKPGLYKTIHSESKNREFVIDDGTGKITVMPLGAEYDLPLTYTAEIDLNHPGLIKDASGPSIGQATRRQRIICSYTLRAMELGKETPVGRQQRLLRRPAASIGLRNTA